MFGLDVIDKNGTSLRPERNGIVAPASIIKEYFLTTEPGQLLVVSKRHHTVAPRGKPNIRHWRRGKEVDRIRARTRTERPKQNWSPRTLDANFLLNEFLKECFPQGGSWCTASKEKFAESTGDNEAFHRFHKRPEYIAHPYLDTWSSDLNPNKAKLESLVLIPNLKTLRDISHQRVQTWILSTISKKKCLVLEYPDWPC